MSGFHLDPDGDVYAQARGKIDGLVAYLAEQKNIPVNDEYVAQLAAFIVESMELRDLYKAVYMPDPPTLHQLVWRANNELDWRAAVIAVRIFARCGYRAFRFRFVRGGELRDRQDERGQSGQRGNVSMASR
jgi:hypothetical protein